jgi:hypothetical protein
MWGQLTLEGRKPKDVGERDRHNAFYETRAFRPPLASQGKSIMTGTPQSGISCACLIALDHLWVSRRGEQPVTKDNAIYSYAVRWSKNSRAEALQEAIASLSRYVPPPENVAQERIGKQIIAPNYESKGNKIVSTRAGGLLISAGHLCPCHLRLESPKEGKRGRGAGEQ